MTITPAALTATIANQSIVYGNNDPAVGTITPVVTGLVSTGPITTWNGSVAAINDSALTSSVTSLARVAGESVGSYNVTAGVFSAPSGNYSAPTFTGSPTLTITPAPTVSVSIIGTPTKVYGSSDPLPSGASVGIAGAVNAGVSDWNGNVTLINDTVPAKLAASVTGLTRVAGENVGTYNYTGGTVALSGGSATNYAGGNVIVGGAQLDITQASLTIAANDASRSFGVSNPPFTASYSGFAFGETPVVLTGSINFATPATIVSPVGVYPIIPSGQSSSNYAITYVNGALSVLTPGAGGGLSVNVPVPTQAAALQTLGVKSYAELWSDCVGGGKASSGGGVAGGAQLSCDAGGSRRTEIPQSGGL